MNTSKAISAVTRRIVERSKPFRENYQQQIDSNRLSAPQRSQLGCGNLAHAYAANSDREKRVIQLLQAPNIGVVSAYNDMLSAHQPYADYPARIKATLREVGATAQVAGATPAMCDGVTQGTPGMELSLHSRDVIAQSTAIALSHQMFDGVLCLGICDKIVPGLLIGSLSFGHLPMLFVPSGPMPSGLPNKEKQRVRQLYAEGKVGREELLASETASYHSAGTCTFYGTANSNQVMMEAMGLQLPGGSFVQPGTPLRDALTAEAAQQVARITMLGNDYRPLGEVVDERSIVNAIVALLATGGSTNHTIHLVAIARAAGIHIDWGDFDELSSFVPLLARVYPNGQADVNHFHAAGGTPYLFGQLLEHGLMHGDALSSWGNNMADFRCEPVLEQGRLSWREAVRTSIDSDVLATVEEPFDPEGGMRLLSGNLGRAVIKTSAVATEHLYVQAPAVVLDSQPALEQKFKAGELDKDCVVVVRFQGPRANGMPELHKLTPFLGILQDRGFKVALVTDGRMSGASGKIPAAIHVSPEAAAGGPLARIRDGDLLTVDARQGELRCHVDPAELEARVSVQPGEDSTQGVGRELFASLRRTMSSAEQGATVLFEAI